MRETWLMEPEVSKGISTDNISYYKCDVSDWEQVNKVAEVVIQEVRSWCYFTVHFLMSSRSDNPPFL